MIIILHVIKPSMLPLKWTEDEEREHWLFAIILNIMHLEFKESCYFCTVLCILYNVNLGT